MCWRLMYKTNNMKVFEVSNKNPHQILGIISSVGIGFFILWLLVSYNNVQKFKEKMYEARPWVKVIKQALLQLHCI